MPSYAFIGGGNMATAMARGLLAQPGSTSVTIAEPDATKHPALQALGASTTTDNLAALASADIVILAIKPQVAAAAVPALASGWTTRHLLVSILAGTPSAKLEGWLPSGAHVVRAMPNTPLAIGQGMVGLCRGRHASDADMTAASALFAPCGKTLVVNDEARMDAITAVSGSGPAYIFRFAEALMTAAQHLGFSAAEAELLVGQTIAGSTAYLMQQGIAHAATLRQQVTSPGGTTAAALAVVDQADFTNLWTRALTAAEARGRELGK